MPRIIQALADERGAETTEWIVVVALLVAVGMAVYTGIMQTSLEGAITAIGTTISGIAS